MVYLNYLQKQNAQAFFAKEESIPIPSLYFVNIELYIKRIRSLGLSIYCELVALFGSVYFRAFNYSPSDDGLLQGVKLLTILLLWLLSLWLLIFVDQGTYKWIKPARYDKIKPWLLKLSHLCLCLVVYLGVFILDAGVTSLSGVNIIGDQNFTNAFLFSGLVGTLLLILGSHWIYRNRKLDILLYIIFASLSTTYFSLINYSAGIFVGVFLVIFYFVLFHLKRFVEITRAIITAIVGTIITIFKWIRGIIIGTLEWIGGKIQAAMEWIAAKIQIIQEWIDRQIQRIIEFFTKIYQFIRKIILNIYDWVVKHAKILVFIGAGVIGGVSYYILENIALSILLFLIIPWKYSPESKTETTAKIFLTKVLYRAGIYTCIIIIGNAYIPPVEWAPSLYALFFLGYIIWFVRNSEELYNLPIYWRLISSIAAIIDSGVMIYLVLF